MRSSSARRLACWTITEAVPNDRPHLPAEEIATRLRDGTPVLIRPIRPDDRDLLREAFERLSEASRLRRFLAPISELNGEQLRRLTDIDRDREFALIALTLDRPVLAVGVGRYARLPPDPGVAEAAITVADECQGKGLGTLLLGLLSGAARSAGVDTFRAYVLEDNAPMLGILKELGARAEHDSPGVLRVDVPLDPDDLPDSRAARLLRAAALRPGGSSE
jgi:RimJ/RimL family protein N-acetyltransferase